MFYATWFGIGLALWVGIELVSPFTDEETAADGGRGVYFTLCVLLGPVILFLVAVERITGKRFW